ncbi:MAG: protein translocase subunit SecD [Streptosporangiales bacterium]|nr:protein translocase subunit SecD [Streptosporangiales bacterium]
MSRAPIVRAVIALAIIGGSLYFAFTSSARLGLDLRGGTQIVLEARDGPRTKADAETVDRTVEVLRGRVDAIGVSEPTLTRSGERRIIIELPGLQDPDKAVEVIGRTAQLSFHPVRGVVEQGAEPEKPEKGGRILADEDGQRLVLGASTLSGEGVSGAEAALDQEMGTQWVVNVDFEGEGQNAWQQLTGEAACAQPGDPKRRVAIVLDDKVISSPQVDPSIQCQAGMSGGSTQITGSFSQGEANDLAVLIEGGALPVPVEIIERRTVGPTLGADAIDASAKAGIIGVILTGLFIIVVYRLVGFLAAIALGCYALISYATLVALGATLTLPGLAGFVLAIGMAVDANVLVFERAREEYQLYSGKRKLQTSMATGFAKAWSAIIDSNVTTLLAAGLLFFLASGPVRGFGVTLSIGVIASMVSALLVTRAFADWAMRIRPLETHPRLTGISSTGRVRDWLVRRKPDLMSRRKLWLGISAVVVVVAIAGIGIRGLNFGVEFTGGQLTEYSATKNVSADVARDAVSDAGFPRAVVQTSGDNISVRTGTITDAESERIQVALERVAGDVSIERDELIGPSLGDELRNKALIALGVALVAQLLYLAIRFRWTFGVGAVLAMFQDVLIVVGTFAWLGKPVDGVFLAALLTVIGYSVNDSVVVFDRIREVWRDNRGKKRAPFAEVANMAVLRTVPRTVNTGMGALFILAALAVLGGDSLTDFSVALLVGIVAGTFSTVFTATPIVVGLASKAGGPPQARSGRPAKKSSGGRSRSGSERSDSGAVI